jgi:hypothetical protein
MKFFKKLPIILFFVILITACKTNDAVKVEDFKVSLKSPQSVVGEIELQLDTLMGMGQLKKQTATVLYFPKEDVICLKYKYEFYTYHQFWNRRGRLQFISALQKYNEDYDARDLQRNFNKSQQKYGTVRSYLVWQLATFTVQAYANMNIDLGYTFKDRSPYFSVYQREAEYLDDRARDSNRTSPALTMYFTRAQAAELSEIFEQYIIPDSHLPDDEGEPDKPSAIPPANKEVPAIKDDIPKDDY